MDNNKQAVIVDLMAKNEETVSVLYKAYADKFPEWSDFWLSLSKEEIGHANAIRELSAKASENILYEVSEHRFSLESIKQFSDYVKERLSEVNEEKTTLKKALSITYDVENSLIENRFFSIFTGDAEELKVTLKKLSMDTNRHKLMAKKALDSLEAK